MFNATTEVSLCQTYVILCLADTYSVEISFDDRMISTLDQVIEQELRLSYAVQTLVAERYHYALPGLTTLGRCRWWLKQILLEAGVIDGYL